MDAVEMDTDFENYGLYVYTGAPAHLCSYAITDEVMRATASPPPSPPRRPKRRKTQ